jgi:HYDIN/CFA65/VesB family protein/type IX secretion system substrate protein
MKQLQGVAAAILVVLALGVTLAQAQIAGDFRSAAAANWSLATTWETYDGVSWNPAVSAPTGSETITITHAVTVDVAVTGVTGYIKTTGAGSLSVSGGSLSFSTGTFEFNQATGNFPIATWGTGSTLLVTGATGSPGNNDQDFYNVTWNCASQSGNQGFNLSSGRVFGGNLTVLSTGTGTQQLRLMNLAASQTKSITINGNVVINLSNTTGIVTTSGSSAGGSFANVTIKGNLTVQAGVLSGSQNSGVSPTYNVEGNVTINGGTLARGSFVAGLAFRFTKTGTQTFTKTSGAISSVVNFTVATGATLDLGTSILDGSTGTFTLSSGGGLIIGSTGGISSSGATGNIQSTGTRTFSTTGNYTYTGSPSPVTGSGLPATVNDLTVNSTSTLGLSGPTTVNGTLTLTNGTLDNSTNNVTMGNGATISRAGGLLSAIPVFGASVNVIYPGSSSVTTANEIPSGASVLNNLTVNDAAGVILGSGGATVNGTLTLTSGTLDNSTNNVTMANGTTISRTGGSLAVDPVFGTSVNVSYPGSSSVTTGDEIPSSSTVLNNLTVNDAAGVILGSGGATVNGTLTLTNGTLDNSTNNVTMANGTTISRTGGSLTAVPVFGTSVNVSYPGSSVVTTGSEIPSSSTVLNDLTVNDAAGVVLGSSATVNGTLALTNGTLSPGSFTLTANGSVTRSTGYVNGALARAVGSGGTPTVDFFVGTGARYTPVSVAFNSTITGAGTLTANSTGAEHSDITNSGIAGAKDVNRFYTVTNSGITPTNYDITLNWDAADVDAGANPLNFVVGKKDGSWSLATSTNQAATSIKATGLSSFSDFAVGELLGSFNLIPPSINFGNVVVGEFKLDSAYVKNFAAGILHVDSINSDNPLFGVVPTSATINAGDSAWIKITFTPIAAGAASGNVVFYHDAAGSPDTLLVSGAGITPVFQVAPTSINYGSVAVGNSKADSVFVKNLGTATLHLDSTNSDNVLFTVTPTTGTVNPGDSVRIRITFSPISAGAASGNIIFYHNAAGSPNSVAVAGNGHAGLTILSNGTGGGSWTSTGTWQGGVVPLSNDSVVILGSDSVTVPAASSCAGLLLQPASKLALNAKLNTTNVSLNGTLIVYVDTLKPSGTVTVGNGAIYRHAQNGGRIPIATWSTGSTIEVTGVVGSSPANGRQTFYNVVWNCINQSASLNLGWNSPTAGVDTTITINGNITVLSTGSGRWQMCAPQAGTSGAHSVARVNIGGNVRVSNRSIFTSNGTSGGFTDIIITVLGNVSVTDSGSQLSISRGSQGTTGTATWYFKGDSVTYGPKTSNQNSTDPNTGATTRGRFVFNKAGTQHVYVDSTNAWTGACNMQFGDSSTATIVDIGNSQFGGSGCTQRIKHNATVIVGPKGFIGGGTNQQSIPSSFTLEDGATMLIAPLKGILSAGSSGAVQVSGTRSYGTGSNYEYNGAAAQKTGGGLPSTVNNLTINDSAGVTIDSTAVVTVNGTLTLTKGLLVTGSNVVFVPVAGTVSRTSGYVAGTLRKGIAAGSGIAKTFEIGDTAGYTPVSLNFNTVTTPGTLTAFTTGGDHPQVGTSGLQVAKTVNRYYTLTNSGIVFGQYSAAFDYVAGDIDGGANPNNFVVAKYDSPNWSLPAVGTRTSTSTQATGMTSFSEYAIGEAIIPAYSLTVNVVGSGSVDKNPDQVTYSPGTPVVLTATPADYKWTFTGWSGDTTGTTNPLTVTMYANKTFTATFTLDSSYLTAYRSFRQDSLAQDKDDKGKVGKFVKRKADKADFIALVVNDTATVSGLHMEFGNAILLNYPFFTTPTSTHVSPDGKNKKWDFTFTAPVHHGDTVLIHGFGNKGKVQKVSKYYWQNGVTLVGTKKKNPVFTRNDPKNPMPNRVNVLFETFAQTGFGPSGLLIGRDRTSDSAKQYGWILAPKYTDAQKSLKDKTGLHTGAARGFDKFTTTLKPILKAQKSIPPAKQNNVLIADMIALKLNIAASTMTKTPLGFGELIYSDSVLIPTATVNIMNGKMVKEIAAFGDSAMMGKYSGTNHVFAHDSIFKALDYAVQRINGAFEGAIDTLDFSVKLHLKGTKQLADVPYLRANHEVVAAMLIPLDRPIIETPQAYTLYQNYPNPFNPTTTIQFDLMEPSVVTLKIYNILGQEVATLLDRAALEDGTQELEFSAQAFASGVYFYRLIAEQYDDDGAKTATFQTVKKMMLIK